MDTRSKHTKAERLRKTTRPASAKLRWKLVRVATGEEKEVEAFNLPCRTTAMKSTTNRRHPCREQRQAQLAKLSKILEEMDGSNNKKIKKKAVYEPAAACAGAMAPENTTQYLMSNVYADLRSNDTQAETASYEASQLYGDSLSPSSVYSALDRGYESCLAFQQRDFDAMFDLCGALDGARPALQGAPLAALLWLHPRRTNQTHTSSLLGLATDCEIQSLLSERFPGLSTVGTKRLDRETRSKESTGGRSSRD
ncbi:hypothetical protein D9C73_024968 [Collichthys lucidus]|uniref:Uncharacterized protein n=1 Tax=Collichthys lucidus TaxID=240159 RepID=A0A4U5VU04_COLLU|nr:hypothetical protein D9C73_024968 [Collichthys lucidus]